MLEIVNELFIPFLSTLLIALAGILATQIKRVYERYVDTKVKKEVVKTVVNAVEQIYKNTSSDEKFNKALENVVMLLNEKGLTVTRLEATMLIESVVAEFNNVLAGEILTTEKLSN